MKNEEEVKEVLKKITVCNGDLAIKIPTENENIKEVVFWNDAIEIVATVLHYHFLMKS
jgi:hypothetical protein